MFDALVDTQDWLRSLLALQSYVPPLRKEGGDGDSDSVVSIGSSKSRQFQKISAAHSKNNNSKNNNNKKKGSGSGGKNNNNKRSDVDDEVDDLDDEEEFNLNKFDAKYSNVLRKYSSTMVVEDKARLPGELPLVPEVIVNLKDLLAEPDLPPEPLSAASLSTNNSSNSGGGGVSSKKSNAWGTSTSTTAPNSSVKKSKLHTLNQNVMNQNDTASTYTFEIVKSIEYAYINRDQTEEMKNLIRNEYEDEEDDDEGGGGGTAGASGGGGGGGGGGGEEENKESTVNVATLTSHFVKDINGKIWFSHCDVNTIYIYQNIHIKFVMYIHT
jgi:hypothetical protein